jgi:putative phosphoribosyl transferase
MRFHDRADAGRQLAARLAHFKEETPLVLGIPNGGVPVAFEVARALNAPLDVWGARKLGAPCQPQLGIGAIAEGGGSSIEPFVLRSLRVSRNALRDVRERERQELKRRSALFRGSRPLPDLEGRTVIVIDDGVATGGTARAVIRAIRARRPRRLAFAAPVAANDGLAALEEEVDDLVCLCRSADVCAIGAWYESFAQTTEEEVLELLRRAPARPLVSPDLVVDRLEDDENQSLRVSAGDAPASDVRR